ncbi:MAG: hypothetical protein LF885_06130 [Rickettsia endosymbiont of Culicoides impunctatus]|nr:MAG: hypothetical protein LF885_06130 [Rickettsia endosymbiont of Culicoides impunctatus]
MKIRYMADNFEDDKDDKNNKGQKDIAYLAQFDNVVNDIKLQIHTTNPAELARLNASITSLLNSNLPPETLAKLQNLQAFVREREEQAEQVVLSQQLEEERKAEADRLASLLEREVKEAAKLEQIHQETARLEEQHKEFTKDADEYLSAMKDENAKLDDVIKDIEKDGDVNQNKLLPLIKTEEQIKKQNEEYKKLYKHRDEIHKHYNEVSTHHQGLLTERKRLGNELTAKEKTEKPQSPTIINTKELIKHQDKKIKAFEPVLAKVMEQKKEVDARIQELEEAKVEAQKQYTKIDKIAEECKGTDPGKHKILKQFTTLLKNQDNAVTNDGKIEDTLLRSEVIDRSKREKKSEYEVDGLGNDDTSQQHIKATKVEKGEIAKIPINVKHMISKATVSAEDKILPLTTPNNVKKNTKGQTK